MDDMPHSQYPKSCVGTLQSTEVDRTRCIIDLDFPGEKKAGWIKFPFLAGKQLVQKGFHSQAHG